MSNITIIKKKISKFNKTISVSGDKSLSIRWVLFSSLANGISTAKNILISEDVLAALKAVKIMFFLIFLAKFLILFIFTNFHHQQLYSDH